MGVERVGLTQNGLVSDPDLLIRAFAKTDRFMGRIRKKSLFLASPEGVRVGLTKKWSIDLMGLQKKSLLPSSVGVRVGRAKNWLTDLMGRQKKSGPPSVARVGRACIWGSDRMGRQ